MPLLDDEADSSSHTSKPNDVESPSPRRSSRARTTRTPYGQSPDESVHLPKKRSSIKRHKGKPGPLNFNIAWFWIIFLILIFLICKGPAKKQKTGPKLSNVPDLVEWPRNTVKGQDETRDLAHAILSKMVSNDK